MDELNLVVFGAPRTKKNTPRLFVNKWTGRPGILPNKLWEQWRDTADIALASDGSAAMSAVTDVRHRAWARASKKQRKGMTRPACMLDDGTWILDATFYREAMRGDADNYVVGLLDLLVARGVLVDDKRVELGKIVMDKDKDNPRVVVRLTRVQR